MLLGVVAAGAAALLVMGLRPGPVVIATQPSTQASAATKEVPQVTVLYADSDVTAMSVVDGAVIRGRTMPRDEAPSDFVSSAAEVVGKVLKESVAAGHFFRKSHFFDEKGSRVLAAVIPQGKRAVGISVNDYACLEGLMFPGSMVDVLVSLKGDAQGAGERGHEAVTRILLENMEVLAIEHETVVSPGKTAAERDQAGSSSNSAKHRIYLLVDTRQAKLLQLGMELGTLSLALRNPGDASSADKDTIFLHNITGDEVTTDGSKPPVAAAVAGPATQSVDRPHWDLIVMHGGTVEVQTFALPTTQPGQKP